MAARKRKTPEEHDNHDRWLISYADFMTLLFAFFVVMYALSSINEEKYRVFMHSVSEAFKQGGHAASAVPPFASNTPAAQAAEKQKMVESLNKLNELLRPMIEQGDVAINQTVRGITINVSASLLFKTGEAIIQPEALFVLAQVAYVLSSDPHYIEVEGHTDDIPINTPLFPSNWELSSARASSVARFLISEGVAEPKLAVVGLAANQPLAPNINAENRARNRRVSITILAEHASRANPKNTAKQ